ncbi:MAG: hypothetical protein K6B39_08940 [Lachnospiraceae bacterium]|nr:hypothetical protein [Lachnospiraceae bacterium]
MKRRKTVCGILLLVLLVTLAACGKSGTEPAAKSASKSGQEKTTQNETKLKNKGSASPQTSAPTEPVKEENPTALQEYLAFLRDENTPHKKPIRVLDDRGAESPAAPDGIDLMYGSTCTLTEYGIFADMHTEEIPDAAESGQNGGTLTGTVMTEESGKHVTEFRLIDEKTGEYIVLARYEGVINETASRRIVRGDKLYTVISIGDPLKNERVPMILAEFDLKKRGLSEYRITENGFPYTSVDEMNGCFYVLCFETSTSSVVYRVNPADRSVKAVLNTETGESEDGEVLRALYTADDSLYVLKLVMESGKANRLRAERYSDAGTLLWQRDITEMIRNACGHLWMNEADGNAELAMPVSDFAIFGSRYLYYSNYSITKALVDLQTGETVSTLDLCRDINSGKETPYFYLAYRDAASAEPAGHIYRLEGGVLKSLPAPGASAGTEVVSLSSAADGRVLVGYNSLLEDGIADYKTLQLVVASGINTQQ